MTFVSQAKVEQKKKKSSDYLNFILFEQLAAL
jgi:hypothetical protein